MLVNMCVVLYILRLQACKTLQSSIYLVNIMKNFEKFYILAYLFLKFYRIFQKI